MPFLEATAHSILNKVLRNTDFTHSTGFKISLHTTSPGSTGANEVSGGSYARQTVTFGAPSAKIVVASSTLEWVNMPTATVTHVGLWSDSTDPALWWTGTLSSERVVSSGNTFRLPSTSLTVTLT